MIGSYYQSLFIFQSTTKRLVLASCYQSSFGPSQSNTRFAIGSSHQSSLSPQSIKNSGDQELLLELIDSPIVLRSIKNFLRSGALVRARWLPDRSKTSCDQKLLLELIDSIVDQQLCDRETLSDLIESLIDQNLLAIRSSYESTLTSWSTDTLVVIGSSY